LTQNPQKQIAQTKQRNYIKRIANFWFGRKTMPKQAKTLTQPELRRVLDYIATRPHAVRNRTMLLATHLAGMRVGEVSNLRYEDVIDVAGQIRDEIRLDAAQTKGRYGRVVFVNAKLKRELETYLGSHPQTKPDDKLFYTQKRAGAGFTPNTLAQHFHYLYKRAGIEGASSHSGRRSFLTNLAAKGVGVRVLMSLAGHLNLASTQKYLDCNDDMKRRAVEMV
jgi:integrase/recombinase XerD